MLQSYIGEEEDDFDKIHDTSNQSIQSLLMRTGNHDVTTEAV